MSANLSKVSSTKTVRCRFISLRSCWVVSSEVPPCECRKRSLLSSMVLFICSIVLVISSWLISRLLIRWFSACRVFARLLSSDCVARPKIVPIDEPTHDKGAPPSESE